MTYKTPADIASSEYCSEHGIYFERFCPDCRLEEWATWKEPIDKESSFIELNKV